MQISNRFSPFAGTLSKIPHAKIAFVIGIFLLGYIAYLFAQLTWLVLDKPNNNQVLVNHNTEANSQKRVASVNVNALRSLNLFGEYNAAPIIINETEDIEDAPETSLNLTLTGVVASNDESRSAAIIQYNGTQEIYAIDETIKGTRAVLKNVFQDRVHIRHSGRLETLMLDGFDFKETESDRQNQKVAAKRTPLKIAGYSGKAKTIQGNPKPRMIDKRSNKNLSKQAQAFKNDIASNPGKITDYLKIAPSRVDGKIIGYRLMPGRNPEFFKSAGLRSGDVAIQMNGLDLSQPAEAAQALKALREERDVSLLLNRNGDITEILFSIDE